MNLMKSFPYLCIGFLSSVYVIRKIYNNRPTFCRVENMTKLFKIKQNMEDSQAIKFCKEHIRSIYGGKSLELKRFNQNLY